MAKTFYYNGIKADGKLIKAHYSNARLTNYPEGTITIYARSILDSIPTLDGMSVKNDSDMQTDYFESDTARITPDSPLYPEALAAFNQQQAKFAARMAARN